MTDRARRRTADALDLLADELVADILHASDEVILKEARDDGIDIDAHTATMRAAFERTLVQSNKDALARARKGVADARRNVAEPAPITDIVALRRKIVALSKAPTSSQPLTLAARNESELTGNDLVGIADDLRELGIDLTKDEDAS
jgi:hypothetical protein